MALPIIMPRQGQSVESCIITAWNKKVGDTVEKGDILFSYETDKSSFDELSPEEGKVIVAGANVVSKHTKARRQGETSSIVKTEGAIYACKVQLVCPKCDKGVRTKVEMDGDKKVRVCAKCGAKL